MLGSAVPMQATDLLAATGAAALGMLAVLHAMVWRAQRQRWALMFTLCMGLGSAYYLADPWLRPVGEQPNPAGSLAGAVLILTLVAAMADYVGLPRRLARRVVAVAVGAGVLALVVRLTGGMPRSRRLPGLRRLLHAAGRDVGLGAAARTRARPRRGAAVGAVVPAGGAGHAGRPCAARPGALRHHRALRDAGHDGADHRPDA
jgi:hypothetical protein